jgi:hypothetical protein
MRVDSVTVDDVGLRPSRLQFSQLMAIVDAAPPPGTTPTEQTRDLIGKVAGVYEGIRIGAAAVHGLSIELPEGLSLARASPPWRTARSLSSRLRALREKSRRAQSSLGALHSRVSILRT